MQDTRRRGGLRARSGAGVTDAKAERVARADARERAITEQDIAEGRTARAVLEALIDQRSTLVRAASRAAVSLGLTPDAFGHALRVAIAEVEREALEPDEPPRRRSSIRDLSSPEVDPGAAEAKRAKRREYERACRARKRQARDAASAAAPVVESAAAE